MTLLIPGILLLPSLPLAGQNTTFEWRKSNDGLFGATTHSFGFATNGVVFAATDIGLFILKPGEERWEPTSVPGPVYEIGTTPTGALLVGTEFGTYRSTDNGATWTLPFNVPRQVHFTYTPNGRIYAVGKDPFGPPGYFYYSDDDGLSWNLIQDPDHRAGGNWIVSNQDGDLLMNVPDTLLISRDDGASWSSTGFYKPIRSLTSLESGEIMALTTDGLWKSTTGGETWEQIDGQEYSAIRFDSSGLYYYLQGTLSDFDATNNNGFQRSNDDGRSRQVIFRSGNPTAIDIAPNGTVWIGANRSIYRSTNGGTSWMRFDSGISNVGVVKLAEGPDGTIYATVRAGLLITDNHPIEYHTLFRSADAGNSWSRVADSIDPSLLSVDAFGNVYTARREVTWWPLGSSDFYSKDVAHVRQSTDKGETWKIIGSGTTTTDVSSDAASNIVAFGTWSFGPTGITGGELIVSTDAGRTWTYLSSALPNWNATGATAVRNVLALPSGEILFSVDQSDDSGRELVGTYRLDAERMEITAANDSLHLTDMTLLNSGTLLSPGFILPDPEASAVRYGIYRSTDDGETWEFAFASNDEFFQYHTVTPTGDAEAFVFGDQGTVRTSDDGLSWEELFYNDSPLRPRQLLTRPDGSIILRGTNNILTTVDKGLTWKAFDYGLHPSRIATMLISNPEGDVLAGTTGNGVYRLTEVTDTTGSVRREYAAGTTSLRVAESDPGRFEVRFETTQRQTLYIGVYDILGREVIGISRGDMRAGSHRESFDMVGYAPGTYLLVLRSENSVESVVIQSR